MKKIIDWCVKNRDAIFFSALSISIILVVTDDIIMKNPHTSLYYIGVIITLIGEFIYMCLDFKYLTTYWVVIADYTVDSRTFISTNVWRQKGSDFAERNFIDYHTDKGHYDITIDLVVNISKKEYDLKYKEIERKINH